MIDTSKVSDHRKLRFRDVDELRAEVDRIEAADKAGRLRCTGNWTAGQMMFHIASWINFAYTGFPVKPPPWPIRFLLKFVGPRYMKKGLPKGFKIPGVKDGTVGMDRVSTEVGARMLRTSLDRLASDEPAPFDSPAFGRMSHADRIQLNLRHAELHLGYLHP